MAAKLTGNFLQDMQNAQRLMNDGRLDEAESLFAKMAKKAPKDPDVQNFLGLTLQQQGKLPKAKIHFQKAIKLAPKSAGLMVNMGLLLKAEGKAGKAEEMYRKALALSPDMTMIYVNLGVVLAEQGRYDEAIEIYENGLSKDPRSPDLSVNLAETLADAGKMDAAEKRFKGALEIAPYSLKALVGYGTLLKNLKRFDEAEAQFKSAFSLAPDAMEVRNNYGVMLQAAGRISEAEGHLAEAARLSPNLIQSQLNYIAAIKEMGRVDEAIEKYEELLKSGENSEQLISNYLLTLNYSDQLSAEGIAERHVLWGAKIGLGKKAKRFEALSRKVTKTGASLRVGYVSHDFRRHSVANFIRPVLRGHDRIDFEVFAYSTNKKADEVTNSIKDAVDHWVDASSLPIEALRERIIKDGIDILIDLGGQTGHNKLSLFAARSAPLQITWIGYPNTTGVQEMDVRLVDARTDPETPNYALGTEELVRLPECFLCYEPTMELPEIGEPPFKRNGFVTFGCFNNLAKIQVDALKAWGGLMKRAPDARLLLKGKQFVDQGVRDRVCRLMEADQSVRERVVFRGYEQSQESHLAVYNEVDIALDTFPYNGTTTTCEAMIMGAPVVTLAGDRHAARVGLSLLSAIGLEALVAETPEDYVACAADLAADRDRLAGLRAGLRKKMETSPLMDAEGFVARYEEILKALFKKSQEA